MNPRQPGGGGGGGALWTWIAPAFNRLLLEDRRAAPPREAARGGRLLQAQDYASAARPREAPRADRPAGDGPVESSGDTLVRRLGPGPSSPPRARGNVWQRPPPGRSTRAGLAVGETTGISTSNMFHALQMQRGRYGFHGLHIGGGADFLVEPADDVGGPRCGRGSPGGGEGGGGVGHGRGNPIVEGDWFEEHDIGGGGDEGPEDGDGGNDDGGDPAPLRLPFVRCSECRLDAMFYCPRCKHYFCEYHLWQCYVPWLWPVRVPGMSLPHVQIYPQEDVPPFPGQPFMFVRAEREGDVIRYYFCRAADVFGVHTPVVPVRIRSFLMEGIWIVQTAQQESHLRRERMFPYPQFWLEVVERPEP